MEEVITRRLNHIDTLSLPDIFLIDGGITQVRAAKKVLKERLIDMGSYGMRALMH